MKFVKGLVATLGLLGGTLAGIAFSGVPALALTDEQVAQRLESVPVFALGNEENRRFLEASAPAGQEDAAEESRMLLYVSPVDAQAQLEALRTSNPDLVANMEVVPLSLGKLYAATAGEEGEQLQFALMPMQQQVQAATSVLQAEGQTTEPFEGVPVFFARSTEDEETLLVIQDGEQEIIPFFFKQEELQALHSQMQRVAPDLAATMTIDVTNFEGLLQSLRSSENEALYRVFLFPPRESLEFTQVDVPEAQPNQ